MSPRTRRHAARFAFAFASVATALGCVSIQDLGSHAPIAEGGALDTTFPFDVNLGFPFDAGPSKLFFVTDRRYTGDLATEGGATTGLAGADNLCNREARAAGVDGVFKAWLSTPSENARNRIAPVGPWRLFDGRTVFAAASFGGHPEVFPTYTASGADLLFDKAPDVWTGTNEQGTLTATGNTCAGWTSALPTDKGSFGSLNWSTGEWTDAIDLPTNASESRACSEKLRLYCFGQ